MDVATLFRGMREADDGYPRCGPAKSKLGVVLPGASSQAVPDVRPDADDNVHPEQGGMSVTPDDWRKMRLHRIPKRLGGTSHLELFAVCSDDVGPDLKYRQDSRSHGLVEPARTMATQAYQAALCDTRQQWSKVKS